MECTGYPEHSTGDDRTQLLHPTLTPKSRRADDLLCTLPLLIPTIPWAQHEQQELALLTCKVLTANPNRTQSPELTAAFQVLLPQLLQCSPFVHAAAAAFGTAYRDCVMSRGGNHSVRASSKSHVQALNLIRREIGAAQVTDVVPVLMTCVLLAAADNIQTRGKDALSHVLGALSMLYLDPFEQSNTGKVQANRGNARQINNQTIAGWEASKYYIVHEAFRWVDIEITTFVSLPSFPEAASSREPQSDKIHSSSESIPTFLLFQSS